MGITGSQTVTGVTEEEFLSDNAARIAYEQSVCTVSSNIPAASVACSITNVTSGSTASGRKLAVDDELVIDFIVNYFLGSDSTMSPADLYTEFANTMNATISSGHFTNLLQSAGVASLATIKAATSGLRLTGFSSTIITDSPTTAPTTVPEKESSSSVVIVVSAVVAGSFIVLLVVGIYLYRSAYKNKVSFAADKHASSDDLTPPTRRKPKSVATSFTNEGKDYTDLDAIVESEQAAEQKQKKKHNKVAPFTLLPVTHISSRHYTPEQSTLSTDSDAACDLAATASNNSSSRSPTRANVKGPHASLVSDSMHKILDHQHQQQFVAPKTYDTANDDQMDMLSIDEHQLDQSDIEASSEEDVNYRVHDQVAIHVDSQYGEPISLQHDDAGSDYEFNEPYPPSVQSGSSKSPKRPPALLTDPTEDQLGHMPVYDVVRESKKLSTRANMSVNAAADVRSDAPLPTLTPSDVQHIYLDSNQNTPQLLQKSYKEAWAAHPDLHDAKK